jgi:Cu/Ag efflux protein CusF
MVSRSVSAFLSVSLVALSLAANASSGALAQDAKPQPTRVRGTVVSFSGEILKVKTHQGDLVDVALAEGARVAGVARAAITDIKTGDYVGIASLPKTSGGDGAIEVLIFPPAMKGTGEGSFGYDLKPSSSMTNATVADAVKGVNGQTLTVSYHGKDKQISVADGTPVVTLAAATKADLKPGAVVFIPAEKSPDGKLSSHQVVVGTNGVVPPM